MARHDITLYWAGPLFTQAERLWNRRCAELLRDKGYRVILPQDEAAAFVTAEGKIEFRAIAEQCYRHSISCDVMIVVLDGADSDSGASLEAGLKIGHRRAARSAEKVIGVRTDFRKSEDEHLNAMFRLLDDSIYLTSVDEDLHHLCDEIDSRVTRLTAEPHAL